VTNPANVHGLAASGLGGAEPGLGWTSMSVARIGWPHSEQRSSTWLIWPQA
jgi:hypothetical protein